MKNLVYLRLFALSLCCLLLLPANLIIAQNFTEAERKERCQNNKNRIAELEPQLKAINAVLSETMSKKEIEDTRSKMVYVRSMKNNEDERYKDSWRVLDRIAAQYNFSNENCFDSKLGKVTHPTEKCLDELEKLIAKKIDKAVSLQNKRTELTHKKLQIGKQIADHRRNLVAYGCDEFTTTEVTKNQGGDANNWKGTFTGDFYGPTTLTLSGGSADYSRQSHGYTQTGSWSLTKVEGNKASGTWKESYEDGDKTAQRNGTLTATLNGNSLSFEYVENEPSFSWKPGVGKYQSGMQKGATFSGALTKKN